MAGGITRTAKRSAEVIQEDAAELSRVLQRGSEAVPRRAPANPLEAMAGDLSTRRQRLPEVKVFRQTDMERSYGWDDNNHLDVDVTEDAFEIATAGLEKQNRGLGIGVEMYQQAVEDALKSGKVFRSDNVVSAEAQNIWRALERRGYVVETNPRASESKLGTGTMKVDPREAEGDTAVFVIRKKKGQTMEQEPVPSKGLLDLNDDMFKEYTETDRARGFSIALKNPVQMPNGSRISGFTDPDKRTTFYGYDKNGEVFTIPVSSVSPEDILSSRDSDRTAQRIKGILKGESQ